MRAIVVAGSPQVERPSELHPAAGDLIIAADLGAAHCLRWGWRPDLVVGDMDSLPIKAQQSLQALESSFIIMPARKDETDLELALDQAVRRGADVIVILGVFGGRIDHTLANFLLLTRPALAVLDVCMVEGPQTVRLLRPGPSLIVAGQPGDILSLIPVGGDANGVTARQVEWPLTAAHLPLGIARGVSNVMLDHAATLSLQEGLLLVIHIRRESSCASTS